LLLSLILLQCKKQAFPYAAPPLLAAAGSAAAALCARTEPGN
jgi:hypothetical protein